MSLAEKALAFAEDKPTQFARAQLLDEAWNRLDARAAERDTAVRAMQEAVHDKASEVRAAGARVRYEDACGGGADTSARLDEVRLAAQDAKLPDEEARCAAALAARYAYGGRARRGAERWPTGSSTLAQKHNIPVAAVDAWQTLAVVRQTRGEVGAALEARRSAAQTASSAALKTREATLTINVGFALTTVGARAEARAAIESGIALGQAIGSPGVERHGKMILLCWAATFGTDASLEAPLAPTRAAADAALAGSWVPHDRAALGVLFYRGMETSANGGRRDRRAHAPAPRGAGIPGDQDARRAARGARPLGRGRAPLRRRRARARSCERGRGAARRGLAELAQRGAGVPRAARRLRRSGPPRRGEARDRARRAAARDAHEGPRGHPVRAGVSTELAPNAGLLAAAEAYGLVPAELSAVLAGDGPRTDAEVTRPVA